MKNRSHLGLALVAVPERTDFLGLLCKREAEYQKTGADEPTSPAAQL